MAVRQVSSGPTDLPNHSYKAFPPSSGPVGYMLNSTPFFKIVYAQKYFFDQLDIMSFSIRLRKRMFYGVPVEISKQSFVLKID